MKVIDNALRGITFDNLGIGATFKDGECYYIKTKMLQDVDEVCYKNAIDLEDGTAHFYDGNEKVIPFDCELIIL